nr:MAG TPA_asm: hypothetical protein [Caudoviricetes sp.]
MNNSEYIIVSGCVVDFLAEHSFIQQYCPEALQTCNRNQPCLQKMTEYHCAVMVLR